MKNIRNVLVIDDSKLARVTLSRLLKAQDLTITEAESVRDGIEILKNESIDAVFIDVQMPEQDGFVGLSLIRNDPELQHLPCSMYSGDLSLKAQQEAIDKGAQAYLFKPATAESVQLVLQALQDHLVTDITNDEIDDVDAILGAAPEISATTVEETLDTITTQIIEDAETETITEITEAQTEVITEQTEETPETITEKIIEDAETETITEITETQIEAITEQAEEAPETITEKIIEDAETETITEITETQIEAITEQAEEAPETITEKTVEDITAETTIEEIVEAPPEIIEEISVSETTTDNAEPIAAEEKTTSGWFTLLLNQLGTGRRIAWGIGILILLIIIFAL